MIIGLGAIWILILVLLLLLDCVTMQSGHLCLTEVGLMHGIFFVCAAIEEATHFEEKEADQRP